MSLEMHRCEFCDEIRDPRRSRFGAIYGGELTSRTVRETPSFVVLPTLGQIFACSMLVVPRRHVETLAGFADGQGELIGLMGELEDRLSATGHVVFFEHGARCTTNGGCGIYHAHLHCVPLPREVEASELLPKGARVEGIAEGWRLLAESDHYLLVRDSAGETRYVDVGGDTHEYGSQYFRRRITEVLEVSVEWDWRKYTLPEPLLFQSIRAFDPRAESPLHS